MAEGDTVFATAARLHRALAGHVLTATDLRVPRYATADLSGRSSERWAREGSISSSERTAASPCTRISGWTARGGCTGRASGGEVGRSSAGRAHDRAVRGWPPAATARGAPDHGRARAPGPSRPGRAGIHLGCGRGDPPPRRVFDREVGDALVDQSVMAGPGNVYRSEVCFLARVDPRTAVARSRMRTRSSS